MAEGGNTAQAVFQKTFPHFTDALGKSFSRVTNHLLGLSLINKQQLDEIKSRQDLSSYERGTELAHQLLYKITNDDNPIKCLLEICDIFESHSADDVLKRYGASMKSEFEDSATGLEQEASTSDSITEQPTEPSVNILSRRNRPTAIPTYTYEGHVHEKENTAMQLAFALQYKFLDLVEAVRQSLIFKNDFNGAKLHVKMFLKEINSNMLIKYSDSLDKIQDFDCLFNFLADNNFIGYLNYKLLKSLSHLVPKDISVKTQVDDYEKKYAELLNEMYCKEAVYLFDKWIDLSPKAPLGLPFITFHLGSPWHHLRFYTWILTFDKFPWSYYAFLSQLQENCIIITYAILPSVLDDVMRDLKDLVILNNLKNKGVTVIKLPQEDSKNPVILQKQGIAVIELPQKKEALILKDPVIQKKLIRIAVTEFSHELGEAYCVASIECSDRMGNTLFVSNSLYQNNMIEIHRPVTPKELCTLTDEITLDHFKTSFVVSDHFIQNYSIDNYCSELSNDFDPLVNIPPTCTCSFDFKDYEVVAGCSLIDSEDNVTSNGRFWEDIQHYLQHKKLHVIDV